MCPYYSNPFLSREGHARVPASFKTESGFKLGGWVGTQRSNYKRDQLSPGRIRRLDALKEKGWVWDPIEADWEKGFTHLEAFVSREGHARVQASFKTESGYPLGTWVSHQRTAYKQGKLLPERIGRLELLTGWVWDQIEADWEEGFTQLESFVRQEGHARVLKSFKTESGFLLGGWVGRQRSSYKRGQLSPGRIGRLEALKEKGWVWDASK